MRTVAERFQASNKMLRDKFGTQIFYKGKAYVCTTKSLHARAGEFIPDGMMNAAASDARLFNFTPSDFAAYPQETEELTYGDKTYTIVFATPPNMIDGNAITLKIYAYRKPVAATSSQDTTQLSQFGNLTNP